ncbi:MAG: 2-oxoacid:ferredoxin oxidoreductase subunit beta [Bacteroidales bacterium]|jgi:2-oxoglutarate ferredoxin oxidoreductase subunit beta|nr:2-oxoacid:ferredoxin oxidoreductase subunit beta [Bacteroidales bacterium]
MIEKTTEKLSKEDFASDQMVKWCPGCGNHAILSAIENVFPQISYKKEKFCVVSGIGCSSRLPYYLNTYGIHGIHGRANAIATGVRLFNRNLSVWIATGDGDSLAIGGNHFVHIIRRNLDVNILLFNNEIYGLTKGQYSPTSPMGKITKSSPQGTIEHPFTVGELVLGAQGTFFARVIDTHPKFISEVLFEAAKHDGTSVVEMLQNCVIFNDGAHKYVTDKEFREDRQLLLRQGEPMIFGKDRDKGIIMGNNGLEIVKIGENGISETDLLVHDMTRPDPGIHLMLAKMKPPHYPIALGVIRSAKAATYDQLMENLITTVNGKLPIRTVDDLLNSGDTWEVN